jgi:hypothetical protein
MKYIGNIPEFNIVHSTADRYDYVQASNPATDTNPSTLYATWLNTSSGELFTCTDNTIDSNVWQGVDGSVAGFGAEYTMLDSVGKIVKSIQGINGETPNYMTFTDGLTEFNGASSNQDVIKLPNIINFNSDFTISISVNLLYTQPNLGSTLKGIIGGDIDVGGNVGFCVYIYADTISDIRIYCGDSTNTMAFVSTSGKHTITIVRQVDEMVMYIDAVQVATQNSIGTIGQHSEIWIGATYQSDNYRGFYGEAGKFNVSNKALTATEVAALYNKGA